jgi:hypothetical protein
MEPGVERPVVTQPARHSGPANLLNCHISQPNTQGSVPFKRALHASPTLNITSGDECMAPLQSYKTLRRWRNFYGAELGLAWTPVSRAVLRVRAFSSVGTAPRAERRRQPNAEGRPKTVACCGSALYIVKIWYGGRKFAGAGRQLVGGIGDSRRLFFFFSRLSFPSKVGLLPAGPSWCPMRLHSF